MNIKPIRTENDLVAAIKRIEVLMNCEPGTPEGDELDVLSTLVIAYEKEHYPFPPVSPIIVIQVAMELRGLNRRDLEPLIGTRARVSEVLSGKRPLTLPMIRRLSDAFDIPAGDLIGTPIKKTRRVTQKRLATPSMPTPVRTRKARAQAASSTERARSRAA